MRKFGERRSEYRRSDNFGGAELELRCASYFKLSAPKVVALDVLSLD
jgi:hypothetical protein